LLHEDRACNHEENVRKKLMQGGGALLKLQRIDGSGGKELRLGQVAPTVAIAVLETAAHVDDAGLPLNKYLVKIDLPDVAWAARQVLDVKGDHRERRGRRPSHFTMPRKRCKW